MNLPKTKPAPSITLELPTGESFGVRLAEIPTLEGLRHSHSRNAKREHMEIPEYFPCMECEGAKVIYDPEDQPCPVEGNKMRNRIKCPTCDGSGRGKKEDYEAKLADITAKVKKSNRAIRRKVKLAQTALNRTKPSEWEALRSLFRGLY